ncbi:uncharacterized protein LOC122402681 [Colletes gigas]|uniref:uncharacterized protein LOC122402681 n=1 Tax=Colletes gigas TaxID=935657 RepID=UPI001C9B2F77|nr:uncharacterized protein LOC122402681 [Colletes gigas]
MAANISDEFDSVNCQRSSLAVNLSCVSNLTDSGNGSLRHIDVGYNNSTSTRINYDRNSKNGKLHKSERTIIDGECTSDQIYPIKDVRILLEKISNEDIMLNKDCERLKEAILTKTKQVFDTQNVLSVKTQKILKTKHDRSDVTAEASAISNKINQKKKQYNANQTINNAPKEKHENKNTDEQRKQFKLKKRRLFDINKSLSNTKTSSNNVNLKCNSSKLYLSQIENNNDESSIVLAGSNKKSDTLNLFSNKSRKLIVPSETKKHRIIDSVSCKDRSVSPSSISEDENTFMAVPICCSTMINDQALDTQNERSQSVHDSSTSLDDNTKKSTVPMEITCLFEKLNNEQQSLEQVVKNITGNLSQQKLLGNDHAPVSLVHATVKVPEPLYENSINLRKSVLYNNVDEQCTDIHYNDQSIETIAGSSANTIQTSLNVNTSVDAQKKYNNNKDKSKQKSCRERKYNKGVEHREGKDIDSSVSEKTQESINTNCTSLEMNTSLDTLNRLHLTNNNSKRRSLVLDGMANKNTDRDENSTNTVNVPKMKDRLENKTPDSRSYIESTPYPKRHPVLFKSQFIQDINNYHNDKNESRDPTKTNFPKNKSHLSLKNVSTEYTNSCYEQEKMENETIIRNNSSVTRESTNESESEKNENRENPTVLPVKRKFKKKLLPLRECSQLLSFSPVDGDIFPPKEPTHIKKRKKLKKEHIKNIVNLRNNEINMNHIERNNNEESLLDNDCTFSNKKKPRKIISKKITIKKIVDEDILRRLQKNREKTVKTRTCISNRNSLNDFEVTTGLSTAIFTKRKVQTINIVATGLSNDDKNMIRSVIKALGCAKLELNVTKRTTHVVTTGVRTINLLHGIIRGCWLVKLEWVLKSLESNRWLNPGEYEMTHFSKAALENRKDRQLFGRSYVPELFAACGYIHIENDTIPPCNVLKDLIKAAGGRIIENPETAKIVIGTQGLKEAWILDCITTGELQPYTQYQQCQSRYKK